MTRFPFFLLRGGTLRVKFLLSVENAGVKVGPGCIINKGRVEGVQRRNIKDRVGWQKEWEERWWVKKNERFADRRPWPTVYVNARLDCNSTQFWRLRLSLLLALSLSLEFGQNQPDSIFFLRVLRCLAHREFLNDSFLRVSHSDGFHCPIWSLIDPKFVPAQLRLSTFVSIILLSPLDRTESKDHRENDKEKNSIIKYRNINIFRSCNPFKIF